MATTNHTTKKCPRCKQVFPLNTEYFGSNKSEKSGFNNYCKSCWCVIQSERRAKRRTERGVVSIPEGQRKCGACGQILPATREHFSTNKMGKDGLQSYCKSCGAEAQRSYRKDHPEAIRATEKRRSQKPDRRDYNRKNGRERYRRDPFRLEKVKRKNARRRALLNQAEGSFTDQDVQLQYKSQHGRCWWCNEKLNGKFSIDHLIPLSRGGSNWPENIVVTCPFCNYSKNNRMPWEWIGRLL